VFHSALDAKAFNAGSSFAYPKVPFGYASMLAARNANYSRSYRFAVSSPASTNKLAFEATDHRLVVAAIGNVDRGHNHAAAIISDIAPRRPQCCVTCRSFGPPKKSPYFAPGSATYRPQSSNDVFQRFDGPSRDPRLFIVDGKLEYLAERQDEKKLKARLSSDEALDDRQPPPISAMRDDARQFRKGISRCLFVTTQRPSRPNN
jgi:hypothetical protein